MGSVFFFDEEVTANDNKGKRFKCQVEVVDNHGVPEVRIGPTGEAHNGSIAEYENQKQFNDFVEAINRLHSRLTA